MAYYFYSANQEIFASFVDRFPCLQEGSWIEDKAHLQQLLQVPPADFICLFIHYTQASPDIDELVRVTRELNPAVKVIFVTEQILAAELKRHQLSEAGADVYLNAKVDNKTLIEVLDNLRPPEFNQAGSRLDKTGVLSRTFTQIQSLENFKDNETSSELNKIFQSAITDNAKSPTWQSTETFNNHMADIAQGDDMSDKDQELSLDDLEDLELGDGGEGTSSAVDQDSSLDFSETPDLPVEDDELEAPDIPMDLADDDFNLNLSETEEDTNTGVKLDEMSEVSEVAFSLAAEEEQEQSIGENDDSENIEELDFMDLGADDSASTESQVAGEDLDLGLDLDLNLSEEDEPQTNIAELSDDAREKLKEIDAIMDYDESQTQIKLSNLKNKKPAPEQDFFSLDEMPMPADSREDSIDSDSGSISGLEFNAGQEEKTRIAPLKELLRSENSESPKSAANSGHADRDYTTVFSGDLERAQATIANLRADREELLSRIQKLEDEKILRQRESLTMRAELDEKKIELSIVRKKLNNENGELKDRLKVLDEKRLILEEKNRQIMQELDKAGQKTKMDVKKVQMRERELEQKLELLKSDAETQIKNRDLKILELKRKLDAMEFDMESISMQEKKTVASRFELEDKLEKAIKTLRSAITVLEEDGDNNRALDAIKKNIDM
jgi:hypothetical protein